VQNTTTRIENSSACVPKYVVERRLHQEARAVAEAVRHMEPDMEGAQRMNTSVKRRERKFSILLAKCGRCQAKSRFEFEGMIFKTLHLEALTNAFLHTRPKTTRWPYTRAPKARVGNFGILAHEMSKVPEKVRSGRSSSKVHIVSRSGISIFCTRLRTQRKGYRSEGASRKMVVLSRKLYKLPSRNRA